MIDFRYHLVSIVSVFLALAVGIVLGAGPLQENLGQQLTKQVDTLRKEKDDLRQQRDAAQADVDARDQFTKSVTPALVASRLGGRSVVVVVLPGADSDAVKATQTVIKAAGAKVNGTVTVQGAWVDPAKRSFRDQLVTQLTPLVETSAPNDGTLDDRLGAILARGLVTSQVAQADQRDQGSEQAMAGLKAGGLVSYDGDPPPRSTLAVVVAGPPDAQASAEQQAAQAASYAALARSLDRADSGTVVAGPTASAADGGLLGVVRSDQATGRGLSTVDGAATPQGQVALALALREQLSERTGHYGTAKGASAVVPDVAAAGTP